MKNLQYIYAMEYYSAMRKEDIMPFTTTCMNLEGIMLSEISQTEKEKCITYVQNLKSRVEWWLQGLGNVGNGDILVTGYKRSVIKSASSGDLMYSMVMISNTASDT